ncbi:O-methyltransferase [Bacillus spongiae]|uniref:tRNA 5-hydroxyuridine methyltransferase n=1 Tax=Bacillus spongiae TaxID=2683610 RepID=A0ABU8H8U4_9BACI
MNDSVHPYIESLVNKRTDLLLEMEEYASEHLVPIMELVGIENFLQLLRIQQPLSILEIGTAIGYSALRMAETLPNCRIVSIERDSVRYEEAKAFVNRSPYKDRITLIYGDALEVKEQVYKFKQFDAVFIDAAKAQYQKFFDLYSPLLSEEGIIYTDNVLFKGFVANIDQVRSRNIRMLVKKIQRYNEWLMKHPDYDTSIVPVGDGMAISIKRGGKNEET